MKTALSCISFRKQQQRTSSRIAYFQYLLLKWKISSHWILKCNNKGLFASVQQYTKISVDIMKHKIAFLQCFINADMHTAWQRNGSK